MQSLASADPPPPSTDHAQWLRVITEERLDQMPLGAVVAAFQDLYTDPTIQRALTKYLSAEIYSYARRIQKSFFPAFGDDLVDDTHSDIWKALVRPDSADGQALRNGVHSRIVYRMKDAVAKERRQRGVPDQAKAMDRKRAAGANDNSSFDTKEKKKVPVIFPASAETVLGIDDIARETDEAGLIVDPLQLKNVHAINDDIATRQLLEELIDDPRQRQAFLLRRDGVPFRSAEGNSIEKIMGVDESTARRWVRTAKQKLKARMGDKK